MYTHFAKAILIAALLTSSACTTINNSLKADPIENTAFAESALSEGGTALEVVPAQTYPFHRVWRASDQETQPGIGAPVFVAPVDTTRLFTSSDRGNIEPRDAERLAEYFRNLLRADLRRHSFDVVDERPLNGRIIELALVEVSSTDVARNVLGTALSAVIPGGGLISAGSSGSTAIEGVVRDAGSGKPLLIFADRERGKIAPFSFNDFTQFSHARDAMGDWAEEIAKVCERPFGSRVRESLRLTLLPL